MLHEHCLVDWVSAPNSSGTDSGYCKSGRKPAGLVSAQPLSWHEIRKLDCVSVELDEQKFDK